jgi:hypothetical protein
MARRFLPIAWRLFGSAVRPCRDPTKDVIVTPQSPVSSALPSDDEFDLYTRGMVRLQHLGLVPEQQDMVLGDIAGAIYRIGGSYRVDFQYGSFLARIQPQEADGSSPRGEGLGWNLESALTFALIAAIEAIEATGRAVGA